MYRILICTPAIITLLQERILLSIRKKNTCHHQPKKTDGLSTTHDRQSTGDVHPLNNK